MFSAREIQGLSQNAPENLIFCSTDSLLKYCAKPRINPEPCIAELFARWLLKKTDPVLKAELARFLPESVIDGVYDRIYGDLFSSHSVLIPDDPLWNTADLSQRRYELAIHQRLVSLFQTTEGFIPVFFGEKGFFLPFHFESIEEQPELPLICDSAGKKIRSAITDIHTGISCGGWWWSVITSSTPCERIYSASSIAEMPLSTVTSTSVPAAASLRTAFSLRP